MIRLRTILRNVQRRSFYHYFDMTWLEGAQNVDELGENDEFVKSDDSDETSPRL